MTAADHAKGDREAYLRPYTLVEPERLDADKDDTPDLQKLVH